MRAVIQRVMKANVTVEDELISSIGKGLCVLIGISKQDTAKDLEYIVRKILNTRLFDDDNEKRWAKNVVEKQYEVLCVSQFTLYHILKGNKPDFHQAMGGEESKAFYEQFLHKMKSSYKPELIKDGSFGAYMQVNIQNDGPVTLTIESPQNLPELKKDLRQQKKPQQKQKKNDDGVMAATGDNTGLDLQGRTEVKTVENVQGRTEVKTKENTSVNTSCENVELSENVNKSLTLNT